MTEVIDQKSEVEEPETALLLAPALLVALSRAALANPSGVAALVGYCAAKGVDASEYELHVTSAELRKVSNG